MLSTVKRRVPALVGVLALVAAFLVATSSSAPPAHADGCSYVTVTRDGKTTCYIVGQNGGGGGGNGNGVNIDCNSNGTIDYLGKTYQCDVAGWSFSYGCYIKPVDPQPATNDPIWGSYDPSTNRAQWEDCPPASPPSMVGAREIIGPCVGYCAGPNPVELVTKELQIDKPDLGMSPPGAAPGQPARTGFVNQNVWFWSKALDTSTQFRAAANVTGTRTFVSADWKVTRANSADPVAILHCVSDNEYAPAAGSAPSPDPACAYQFTTPDTYTITVTTTWTLVITQNGVAGAPQTITSVPNTAVITITEAQSTNG